MFTRETVAYAEYMRFAMIDDNLSRLIDESSTFSLDESFELSRVCAEYLNAKDETKNEVARKIIIHVLDR